MKKLSAILLVIVAFITLSGCSNKENEQYENAMSNGKSSVIEEEYDKAIDYFDLALESKKDDEEATNLIKQLKLLLQIEESEDHGAYFYQMERIDKINSINTETDVVKKKANDYKETVLKNIDDSLDSVKEKIKSGDYESAQNEIEDIIKECKKSDSLREQLDKSNEILKSCKAEKKKAEEEAEKQAKKAAQKQAANNSNQLSRKNNDNSGKVHCSSCKKYVNEENYDGTCCFRCITESFYKTYDLQMCPYCDLENCTVNLYTGICNVCGRKVKPAVAKIREDGTVILEDGTIGDF